MIEVKNLTKSFGARSYDRGKYHNYLAVNDVSFKVSKGEVLGFLGPNGAGKSTTMRMLACFIPPTSGEATIGGHCIIKNPIEVRRLIGYMPENAPLYDEMTVREFLSFMADLREIEVSKKDDAIENVIKMCALEMVVNQPIETLSKGFKRRVSMAQSLIHNPEVLIMDEPTDGLDPVQKYEVRELIKKLAKDKCIILSTHILEEVEAVCSRAIIIANGIIKFDGTAEEFKNRSDKGKIDDVFRAIATDQKIEGVHL